MTRTQRTFFAVSTLLATASIAGAHTGHEAAGGFSAGASHPIMGLDHLLAMVAVGVLAGQMGRTMRWALPLTFVALMIGGGLLARAGVAVPAVEQGIAASVFVLGLLIAGAFALPRWLMVGLVGVFAIFHGHAHVSGMPVGSFTTFAVGFVLTTAFLHALGLGLGVLATSAKAKGAVRFAGAGVCACGLLVLAGFI